MAAEFSLRGPNPAKEAGVPSTDASYGTKPKPSALDG